MQKPKWQMAMLMGGYLGVLIVLGRESVDWPDWGYWVLVLTATAVYAPLRLFDIWLARPADTTKEQ